MEQRKGVVVVGGLNGEGRGMRRGGLQDEARAPSPTTDEELQRVGRGRMTDILL